MSFVKNTGACIAALLITALSFAQQKQLTDDQYFKSTFKDIIKPLPAATRWTDNSHFLLIRDGKTFTVDANTGIEKEATDADRNQNKIIPPPSAFTKSNDLYIKIDDKEIRLTNDTLPEINATASPDGKYIAFTKNNDLYTAEIATKNNTTYQ